MTLDGLTLVVAEKPSVARDLARALGRLEKREGYLESPTTLISWAIGHLLELAEPSDYDPRYERWSLEDLPILPPTFKLNPISRTKKQLQVLASLMTRPDVTRVVNACDAGREGELIFRYVYEAAGCDRPVSRLWVSSLTEEAIIEGFATLKPGEDYDLLYAAARSRNEADWLVGINGSRALTKKVGLLLPVGRVQTPTLAMIVQREKEILAFTSRDFWQVHLDLAAPSGPYRATWAGGPAGDDRQRIWIEEEAAAIAAGTSGAEGVVETAETKVRKFQPPLLYDLNELQREMNRRHGFPASRTLSLAQELYEREKALTYPRTDSRHLPPDLIPRFPAMLRAAAVVEGLGEHVEGLLGRATAGDDGAPRGRARLPVSPRFVNSAKVSDHHAIVPTTKAINTGSLSADQLKVYEAVCRRFVAAFLPAAVDELTTVTTRVAGEPFFSQGRRVVDVGWHAADRPAYEADLPILPALAPGDRAAVERTTVEKGQTKPAPRYNEASLLQAMQTAGKLIEDDELREMMKDRGIGTPATRAAIIERLIDLSYVRRDRRTLFPTEKGMWLIDLIPVPDLVSPDLTGKWELKLREIQDGRLARESFMRDIAAFTGQMTGLIRDLPRDAIQEGIDSMLPPCPLCGNRLREGPRFYYCPLRTEGCRFLVGKVIAGRRVAVTELKTLIEDGKTPLLRGFISRNKRPFSARLVLSEGQVVFSFPPRRADSPAPATDATAGKDGPPAAEGAGAKRPARRAKAGAPAKARAPAKAGAPAKARAPAKSPRSPK